MPMSKLAIDHELPLVTACELSSEFAASSLVFPTSETA